MKEFSRRLREIRNEKQITQKQVASDLEMSITGYAGYEQGYREPDLTTLARICIYFNVSADYLIGLENEDGSRNTINGSFNNNSGTINFKA